MYNEINIMEVSMKRYIRASISPSMPDWLRKAVTGSGFNTLRDRLVSKYNVSLDTAEFQQDKPGHDSYLTFYWLRPNEGFSHKLVYCPGVNDDEEDSINGRWRKLGSIAKSKLPAMSEDICYLDLTDPNNVHPSKTDRYQDPRYSYRNSRRGTYMGQYKNYEYLGGGEYSKEGTWSTKGRTASNENRSRDKSGYRVPSPEEMIARYYERFPDKVTNKLNALYDRILKVRVKLINADFNTPSEHGSTDIRNAYSRFGNVASDYQRLLSQIDGTGKLKRSKWGLDDEVEEFSKQVSYINRGLDEVEEYVEHFNSEERW